MMTDTDRKHRGTNPVSTPTQLLILLLTRYNPVITATNQSTVQCNIIRIKSKADTENQHPRKEERKYGEKNKDKSERQVVFAFLPVRI